MNPSSITAAGGSEIAAPSIVTKTADGKILAAIPLKPVPFIARGAAHWNHCIAQPRKRSRRPVGLEFGEAEAIRHELDEALVPIARKHCLSVRTLLKLASVGGSATA